MNEQLDSQSFEINAPLYRYCDGLFALIKPFGTHLSVFPAQS